MSVRVLWSPHAEARLEEILRGVSDSTRIVLAARQLDLILHSAPEEFGESRFETVRVGFVHPLGIQYELLADVQTVIVYDVWRIELR